MPVRLRVLPPLHPQTPIGPKLPPVPPSRKMRPFLFARRSSGGAALESPGALDCAWKEDWEHDLPCHCEDA